MFDELDTIDWAAMDHAYGPATDVPDLLRGLVSADAATREYALDGMFGAVHHQGDVYECTLTTIPFLLAMLRDPDQPDRAELVMLLASYAGREPGWPDRRESEPGSTYAAAKAAIGAAWDDFAGLLADPDPAVRAAAVLALSAARDRDAATADLLLRHYPAETDSDARLAVLETLGLLTGQPGVAELFAEQAATGPDPQTRIAALTAGLGSDGGEPAPGMVDAAVSTMLDMYGVTRPPRPAADRPATDTLIGAIRQAKAESDAGRSHPDVYPLLLKLFRGFGDRADEQNRLLTLLLRSDSWEARLDAIPPATMHVATWRGDHGELIGLIGEQLGSDRPRLRDSAAKALSDCGDLAAPAADELARVVATGPQRAASSRSDPAVPWLLEWDNSPPTLGPALHALLKLRDPRALPALAWVLEQPRPPSSAGYLAAQYGTAASELVPLLLRRCEDSDGDDHFVASLARAAAALGGDPARAARALLTREPTETILSALGEFGPAVGDLVTPTVRGQFESEHERRRAAAALALWRLTGDTDGVAELARQLPGNPYLARTAADALAEIGPAAAAAVPALRRLHTAERERHPWPQLAAAIALWRITGETAPTLPTLLELWPECPYMRPTIAECLAAMGSDAEPVLGPVLGELASRRRYYSDPDDYPSTSHLAPTDGELLRHCRSIARACGG